MRALVLDAEWSPRAEYDLSDEERDAHRATDSSAVWRNPRLRLETRDRPDPAPDEVLVRVRYAGICGSDVSLVETDDDGYVHYSAYTSLPTVLGHEFAGEVVETGTGADLFSPGERVTAEVTEYCGRCGPCREGFYGHCEQFEQVGFTRPGALAEYVAVPEKLVWSLEPLREQYGDTDTLLRAGATVEPSTITYHGLFCRADGVRPGDYHVYHGMGPIGLTGMNVSRASGAGAVVGFDPSAERRDVAASLGFDHVFDPTDVDPVAAIETVTDGQGADVHVETSGAVTETYPVIDETLANGANVVHISNAATAPSLDLRRYQGASGQVYGSEGHTGQGIYPRVIRLMAGGHLDNRPVVTTTFDLPEAEQAVERAAERVDGKVLVET